MNKSSKERVIHKSLSVGTTEQLLTKTIREYSGLFDDQDRLAAYKEIESTFEVLRFAKNEAPQGAVVRAVRFLHEKHTELNVIKAQLEFGSLPDQRHTETALGTLQLKADAYDQLAELLSPHMRSSQSGLLPASVFEAVHLLLESRL